MKKQDDVLIRQIRSLNSTVEHLQNALAKLQKDYQAAEFWTKTVYPDGMSAQDVVNELTDYHTYMDTWRRVYDHVTNGRISKINTSASAIIGEIDEIATDTYRQTVKDVRDEINELLDGMA